MSAGVEPGVVSFGQHALDDALGRVAVDALEHGNGAVRPAQPLGALGERVPSARAADSG